ncbi:PHA/PHB synthase family protein [Blastochloris sulfoviridis]|uniref:Alpha/beta fold hydrolase n=1 Tax=Blastochloris sulfoviridis TaxID=50712 RepID=A0A5M6I2H3_9HYPH|nr:alpha/beta fold hydrolase [Blastochloris sulfoviridis]KAA5602406.1 alpha/beta fold hydrolase [Blastochloris sulfoviridis]
MQTAVSDHRQTLPAPESERPAPILPAEADWDRYFHAGLAALTGGFSPIPLQTALYNWAAHLATSPARQAELSLLMVQEWTRFAGLAMQTAMAGGTSEPAARALPQDRRFRHDSWRIAPYALYAEAFLGIERWWREATTGGHGIAAADRALLEFVARQALDTVAPSNFPATNPEILERIMTTGGRCLVEGALNAAEDWTRKASGQRPRSTDAFVVGKTVATAEGSVVLTTPLCEVIQYRPRTATVRPEPVLMIPAWIMKYYILDLSPANSLVNHLLEAGFTVFMISWKNPTPEDRDVGFDDYRRLGLLPALQAALAITGARRAHGVGYCLGGTLLAIAAAAMARDGDDRLASLSFLAAQTDFEEAGELKLFVNESQVSLLEDMMWRQGVLAAPQMQGTFNLLRSNDLIWSKIVKQYWMGDPEPSFDIMAWATDATRMPYRMHSEYLRSMYLNNDLARGHFLVDGRPVVVQDIRAPVFALGTEWDHVAPWRSVYKFNLLADSEVTFVLTNGGHNQGVVSPPGRHDRHYRIATRQEQDRYIDPEAWVRQVPPHPGSWWPAWFEWLAQRSGAPVAPPPMGRPDLGLAETAPAPGSYVLG